MRICKTIAKVALIGALVAIPATASAQSLKEALALAYSNNPAINAQRAATRSVDETVAIAKSGYRPVIAGDADISKSWSETRSPLSQTPFGATGGTTRTSLAAGGFGVTISQTLFDGFKTQNNVRASEAAVMASREALRNIEQNILFDAAAVYMDVIRDAAVASFRAQALEFLNEQVRSENSRFEVGESTRTDVSQARGRRAAAEAELIGARARLKSSEAVFRQVIGQDPSGLTVPPSVEKLLPGSITSAVAAASTNHPAIKATRHLVDQALFNVKSAESDLLPSVTLQGNVQRRFNVSPDTDRDAASLTARLQVPIYQGGRVSAQVRQNKEVLGQRRIEVDQSVDNVRAAVVSAYSQLEAANAQLVATGTQLEAARLALQGAVEERRVGQRTTLDVLNTQQDVINAQIAIANAQRDKIVASYAALSAIGKLRANTLGLQVASYDPEEHYLAVKDKWYGLRTPDGQ